MTGRGEESLACWIYQNLYVATRSCDVACGSKRKTRLNNIDRVDSSVLKFHALYTTTVLFCSVGEATGQEESKGSCCFHQRCMRGFCINRE